MNEEIKSKIDMVLKNSQNFDKDIKKIIKLILSLKEEKIGLDLLSAYSEYFIEKN